MIFKGLSLSFRRGEKTLLLGPSGCGKSTLLQVLSGIVPHTVELPMKADDLVAPEKFGYVFQDPDAQFCMPYVDEELAFVLENLQVTRERMPELIRRYIELVGLQLKDIHTPIRQLSQGMKQRLAVACILALEPDVIFLDEPTALLDPEGTEQVWETIRNIAEDKTLIVVEHKIDGIIGFVDRVVVFTPDGDVLADGQPDEVFRRYRKELTEYGIWHPGVWDDAGPPLRTKPAPSERTAPEPDADRPVLSLRDFRGFRGGRPAVAVSRADVQAGDWIAVVGPNGAGKSSLLLAIMRLIRSEGSCLLQGTVCRKPEQAALEAAFVFQNPELQFVTDSVEAELAFSLDPSDPAVIESALAAYGLLPLRERHPYQLSMGQKRRLSVASALIRGQRLLLLDEPTFGLDARSTFRLLVQLERLRAEGTAILMVTHDPHIVRRCCNRIWRVSEGKLTESEAIVWS
ncbi:ABC transporter ATP-binding protein [Paenibacillus thermotolerans]|uniref:ABC transporter ATP-binding protein n=1 Tax=Paenibacillus thermotolerans TaxID=3027807 RepID=UPI0030822399